MLTCGFCGRSCKGFMYITDHLGDRVGVCSSECFKSLKESEMVITTMRGIDLFDHSGILATVKYDNKVVFWALVKEYGDRPTTPTGCKVSLRFTRGFIGNPIIVSCSARMVYEMSIERYEQLGLPEPNAHHVSQKDFADYPESKVYRLVYNEGAPAADDSLLLLTSTKEGCHHVRK